MPLTVAQWRDRFPTGFENASDPLIQAKLDEAYRRLSAKTWGDRLDDGAAYLTAHLIAISPGGEEMRIGFGGQEKIGNLFDREFQRLKRAVVSGFRVTGDTDGIST